MFHENNMIVQKIVNIWNSFFMKTWVTTRVRPRFFDQVGHETMYASSGNKHFFTKSCHFQTYQNYERS